MPGKRKEKRIITPNDLDPLIHERLRLGIISVLAVQESMSFVELRSILQTTDGNLSVQTQKLESAGYVHCDKIFEGRKPKSIYRLSDNGRCALDAYLETLAGLLPDLDRVKVSENRFASTRITPLPTQS